LVSFDRYTLHLASCKIWRQFIHLDFEKQGNPAQKFTSGNRKVSKKQKNVINRPLPNFRVRWAYQSFQKGWSIFKRVKSWRWFQVGFID
jgi:hypothetical protein